MLKYVHYALLLLYIVSENGVMNIPAALACLNYSSVDHACLTYSSVDHACLNYSSVDHLLV